MINSGQKLPARPLTKIIGGILTTTNSFAHKNNSIIQKHISALSGLKGIDLGCIANYGSFSVHYHGEENIEEKENLSKRINDYYENRQFDNIVFSKPENSLIAFFMDLMRYLQQRIGTIPAIDFQAYMCAINKKSSD